MSVIGRDSRRWTIYKDSTGRGNYLIEGPDTADNPAERRVEVVPAKELEGAVEALRTIALFNTRDSPATGLPSAEARIAREWLEANGLTISGGR